MQQNKNFHIYIYGLKEKNRKIRYVGKTNNLKRRFNEHLNNYKKNKTHKDKWINSILTKGSTIEIIVLETVTIYNWKEAEKKWIKKLKKENNLVNHTNGGDGGKPKSIFLNYIDAKLFIHNLKIKNLSSWIEYCKTGNKPKNIPADPRKEYLNKEWKGYGDWLGTFNKSPKNISKNFLSYHDATKITSKLELKTIKQWGKYCKTGNKPKNIPADPRKVYKNSGWNTWSEWLGNNKFTYIKKLPYKDAKLIVHQFNLKTMKEWQKFYSKTKPKNLPFNPQRTYKNDWISWRDWLGVKHLEKYVDYKTAHKNIENFQLKSKNDWFKFYDKNNMKKIPKHPQHVYKNHGWVSWYHFLGKKI